VKPSMSKRIKSIVLDDRNADHGESTSSKETCTYAVGFIYGIHFAILLH